MSLLSTTPSTTSMMLKRSSQRVALRYLTAVRKRFWHGTSSKYLRQILKQGLIPFPKERQFEDVDRGGHISIETFGGVYLTDNFVTASSYAKGASRGRGGNPLYVGVTLETRSPQALPDEDTVIPMLASATGTGSAYDLADRPRSFWNQALRYNNLVSWEGLKPEFDKILNVIETQDLSDPIQKFFGALIRRSPRLEGRYKRQKGRLDALLSEALRKHAIYLLYLHHKERSPSRVKELKGYLDAAVERGDLEFIPSYESEISKWENPPSEISPSSFRVMERAITALSRHIRESLDPRSYSFSETLRLMEPLTYRGKNRIQVVVETATKESGVVGRWNSFSDIVVHYAQNPTAIEDFVDQYERHIGGSYRTIYRNRVVSHYLNPTQEWPTDIWGTQQ